MMGRMRAFGALAAAAASIRGRRRLTPRLGTKLRLRDREVSLVCGAGVHDVRAHQQGEGRRHLRRCQRWSRELPAPPLWRAFSPRLMLVGSVRLSRSTPALAGEAKQRSCPGPTLCCQLVASLHGTRDASGSGHDCHALVTMELIFSLDQENEAWEMHEIENGDRKDAFQAAKLAVRAYARDPSPENEAAVAEAFRRIRRLNGVARWRKAACADCLHPVGSN